MSESRTGEYARGSVGGYIHDALLYDSVGELTGVAAPFLLEGLAAGDAAVIAAGARTTSVLTEAVDGDPRVHVLGRSDVYGTRTPAAITAASPAARPSRRKGAATPVSSPTES